jgi:hypothetical protein
MLHDAWQTVVAAMTSWHQGKLFIEHAVAINHDALHVIIGVLAWMLIASVMRRPLSSPFPWSWLLALILWNETVDLWTEQWPDVGMQYGEGAKDILLTMFLPTVMMIVVRIRPALFSARGGRVEAARPPLK